MLKSIFHWKVLLNVLLAAAVFLGLVWLTFRWLEIHTNHGKEVPVPNVVNKSVKEAIRILDDAGLDYEVDSFKFDPRYRPYQVLQVSPMAGSHVKGGRTIFLRVNPKTWAPVQVPDILDRYKGLAFRQLDLVGLKVGDTLFEPSIQKDAVIRMMLNGTTLKPGTKLPRFSTIDLVIGTGPKRNIPIPSLVGLTVAEAKVVIAQNLFEIGLVEHEDGGKDDRDIVYYQDPAASDLRDQGMQIDLWASKKSPSQMAGKISQLDAVYRVKIDTTLPPIQYEEVPTIQPDQDYTPAPEPVVAPKPEPVKPKPAPVKKPTVHKSVEKSTSAPKKSEAPKTTAPKPVEQPKPKAKVQVD